MPWVKPKGAPVLVPEVDAGMYELYDRDVPAEPAVVSTWTFHKLAWTRLLLEPADAEIRSMVDWPQLLVKLCLSPDPSCVFDLVRLLVNSGTSVNGPLGHQPRYHLPRRGRKALDGCQLPLANLMARRLPPEVDQWFFDTACFLIRRGSVMGLFTYFYDYINSDFFYPPNWPGSKLNIPYWLTYCLANPDDVHCDRKRPPLSPSGNRTHALVAEIRAAGIGRGLDGDGDTWLMKALDLPCFPVIEGLILDGVDLEKRNSRGQTALFVERVCFRAFELLLENGADIKALSPKGATIWHVHLKRYLGRSAEKALNKATGLSQDEFSAQWDRDRDRPYKVQCRNTRDLKVVALLNHGGASLINQKHPGTGGIRPIHMAVLLPNAYDMVRRMLRAGADPNAPMESGTGDAAAPRGPTPLHLILYANRPPSRVTDIGLHRVVALLLKYGACRDARDHNGDTVYDLNNARPDPLYMQGRKSDPCTYAGHAH